MRMTERLKDIASNELCRNLIVKYKNRIVSVSFQKCGMTNDLRKGVTCGGVLEREKQAQAKTVMLQVMKLLVIGNVIAN